MDFYRSIASHYGQIFPLNPMQVDFTLSALPESLRNRLLDVGCANATLLKALAPYFKQLYGIDLDEDLVRLAGAGLPAKVHLEVGNMLHLHSRMEGTSLDAVLCFGNTLVHLDHMDQVLDFSRQCHHLLRPGGKFLLQIIHYDRILDQSLDGLPTIHRGELRFERNYSLVERGGNIRFDSILHLPGGDEPIANSVDLLPLRRAELERILQQAGFSGIRCYGSFKRDALRPESMALVVEATR